MQIPRCEAIQIFLSSFLRLRSNQTLSQQYSVDRYWRVGGQSKGGITAGNVILIGLIHITQGSWRPILQLDRYII